MLIETLSNASGATVATGTHLGWLVVNLNDLWSVLIVTLIFTIFGLLAFSVAFLIIGKATPFSIRKEIEEDQNTALAIVIGAVILGIAMIIAAAIHG